MVWQRCLFMIEQDLCDALIRRYVQDIGIWLKMTGIYYCNRHRMLTVSFIYVNMWSLFPWVILDMRCIYTIWSFVYLSTLSNSHGNEFWILVLNFIVVYYGNTNGAVHIYQWPYWSKHNACYMWHQSSVMLFFNVAPKNNLCIGEM